MPSFLNAKQLRVGFIPLWPSLPCHIPPWLPVPKGAWTAPLQLGSRALPGKRRLWCRGHVVRHLYLFLLYVLSPPNQTHEVHLSVFSREGLLFSVPTTLALDSLTGLVQINTCSNPLARGPTCTALRLIFWQFLGCREQGHSNQDMFTSRSTSKVQFQDLYVEPSCNKWDQSVV